MSNQTDRAPVLTCGGKIRYASMGLAERAMRELIRKDGRRGRPKGLRLTAYDCPFCPGYHVGHAPYRLRRRCRRRWKAA